MLEINCFPSAETVFKRWELKNWGKSSQYLSACPVTIACLLTVCRENPLRAEFLSGCSLPLVPGRNSSLQHPLGFFSINISSWGFPWANFGAAACVVVTGVQIGASPPIFPWLSCGAFSRWQGLELLNWLDLVSSWAALSALWAEQLGREQLGISSSRYLRY